MVTKQDALAEYNSQNNTNYTLTTLGTYLLGIALRDAWLHKRRAEVLAPLDLEIVT